jgi:hypothetical protein
MTVTGNIYANFYDQAASGNINWASDTIKLALLGSGYSPNLTSHVHWSDVSSNEVTGTGYTSGGVTLGTKTHVVTAANSWGTSAATSTAYALGAVVRPATANGYLYQAVVAGTSGSSAPTWPTTYGATVTDGGVTWANIGESITVWSSAAASWSSATISANYGVIYDAASGTSTTEPLIALITFGGTVSSTASTYTVTPSSSLGWFFTTPQ